MGDWFDPLLGFASELGADITAFLNWLLNELIAIFWFLDTLIGAVFWFFDDLFSDLYYWFQDIWDNWLKGIFQSFWSAVVKVHDWIESILAPIIHVIQVISNWVQWVYNTWLKPILSLISKIRGFLNILAALNIKWAQQLDQWLGKVQTYINQAFTKVMGYLNTALGLLNSLADPLGLFRKPTFVMSMRRIFPSFARGISGMPLGYWLPQPGQGAPAGMGPSSFPLNLSDPTQNPLPSGYADDDDGLGDFDGFDDDETPDDSDMDVMQPLDYFNDDSWPDPTYDDPSDGGNAMIQWLTQNSVYQGGS